MSTSARSLSLSLILFAFPSCCDSPFKCKDTSSADTCVPMADVEPPGFMDIGAGYGYVKNFAGTRDAMGPVVSLKAYPWGRWYSRRKSSTLSLAEGLIGEFDQDREQARDRLRTEAIGLLPEDKQTELTSKTRELEDLEYRELLGETVDSAKVTTLKGEVAALKFQAEEKLSSEKKEDLRSLEAEEKRLQSLSAEEQNVEALKRLIAVRDKLEADQYVTIKERSDWFNKLSIYFAYSPNEFDSGSLESQVYSGGLGIDVTPYLAFMAGYAFYEDETGIDVDSSPFFGLSLNLSTLQTLLGSSD